MKKKHLLCLLLATFMVIGSLTGCSAKSEAVYDNGSDRYFDGLTDSAGSAVSESEKPQYGQPSLAVNQKLVRTMTLESETNDMDALLATLDSKISSLGGYLEKKSTRNGSSSATHRYRYAELTVRIPADRLGEFVDHVSGETNVTYYNETADDITLRYVATQSRITALETEEKRLLELLAQAENMTDLLLIEERLTNVRTELEQVTSQMRLYDNMVDYGTVHLTVTEVQEFTPTQEKTMWQKIGSGLADSWKNLCKGAENLFVFLIVSLPYLIPIGGIVTAIVFAVRSKKRKAKKKETPPAPEEKQ